MPQIILNERIAHLYSYTFFTRGAGEYKNMSFS